HHHTLPSFPTRRSSDLSTANNSLQVADYWTMFNTIAESNADQDLGSGGVVVLPDMIDSGGITRHLAVGGGKDGHLYIVNRDNMGDRKSTRLNSSHQIIS